MASPKPPVLIIYHGLHYENEFDMTALIKELNITHEDIDEKNSGRDTSSGAMKRKRVNMVHTLTVTLRRIYQSDIVAVENALENYPRYKVKYRSPCGGSGGYRTRKAYTSTINFGAQRYDRNTGDCFYDGVNFKIIEWGDGDDDTGGSSSGEDEHGNPTS